MGSSLVLALACLVGGATGQTPDPYVELASHLPSETITDYNELMRQALDGGKYVEFLAKSAAVVPDFNARLANINAWAAQRRFEERVGQFDRYTAIKGIAKEASRRAFLAAAQGNTAVAADSCIANLKMARLSTNGGAVIGHLVESAVVAIAIDSLKPFAQSLPIEKAKELQAEAEASLDPHVFLSHLKAETDLGKGQTPDFTSLMSDAEKEQVARLSAQEKARLEGAASAKLREFMDQATVVLGTADKTTYHNLKQLCDRAAAQTGLDGVLVRGTASILTEDLKAEIKRRALLEVAWLYCAVDIYRAEHGTLPKSLELAAPKDRLVEPYSGAAYQYTWHDSAFWIELPETDYFPARIGLRYVRIPGAKDSPEDPGGDIPPR